MAVITPDKGLFTSSSLLSSLHFVFIDKESLPTGIAIPNSIHMLDKASTPVLRAKFSSSSPHAAIQFAESLTRFKSFTGAEIKFISASAKAILKDAAGLLIARVGFSPIDKTSPSFPRNDFKDIA